MTDRDPTARYAPGNDGGHPLPSVADIRDWTTRTPKSMSREAAVLADLATRKYGDDPFKAVDKPQRDAVSEEIVRQLPGFLAQCVDDALGVRPDVRDVSFPADIVARVAESLDGAYASDEGAASAARDVVIDVTTAVDALRKVERRVSA